MKILIAIDGSEFGDAIADFVNKHSWGSDAVLRILHVVEPETSDQYTIDAYQMPRARDIGERLAAKLSIGANVDIHTEVALGNPKERIVHEAKEWGAQLIIVGSHGFGEASKFSLGSVSAAVVARAPCSVMVVRLPHKSGASDCQTGNGDNILVYKSPVQSGT